MGMKLAPRLRGALALSACLLGAGGCASIPEGRSAVDSVRVAGARDLDTGDLATKLATAESPKFLGLLRGVVFDYEIFDASVLQRDLARVEHYCRAHGFLEAHARAARVQHKSANHVRVEIVVDEGPPTQNGRISVEGLDGVPPDIAAGVRAAAEQALPAGVRFDEDAYKKAQTEVGRALTDHGYAYATVRAEAQANLATHTIDYDFTLVPGPPAVFGAVTIVGLDPDAAGPAKQELDEAPLRRAMNIRPGETYSTATIEAATQALLDLEVMGAVQIIPQLSDPPTGVVPLIVRIEPAKLRETRLGGGFELDQIKAELHGLIGWEDHNFLGNLRDFSVELKPGVVLFPTRIDKLISPTDYLPEERLRAQLRMPGVIEPRTTLFVRPEMNVYPLLVSPDPKPDQPVVGYIEPKGAVGLDRRFGKHLVVSLAQNVQGEIPFFYLVPAGVTKPPLPPSVFLSYPQLVTTLDYRDDPIHTHKGFWLSNDFQVAGLGGTAQDVRVTPEVRGYVPLAHGVTLAARTQVGFLFAQNYGDSVKHPGDLLTIPTNATDLANRNSDIQIAYFRGFFSGGPSSNRGFPLRGIAPHGVVPFLNPATARQQVALNCDPTSMTFEASECLLPIGGFTQWEASVEGRFEISGPLGAAIFCDAGDVAAKQAEIRLDHLHLSCGAGVRYDTPVGPIRLDIGYRIPFLQVLPYKDEAAVFKADNTEGIQPSLFGNGQAGSGIPLGLSFGVLEAF
jgi:outer membrane protein insertion porin family/translocation and assembly module TamA